MARFLTRKQRQVIETIRTLIEENGYSPSVRELGGVLGLAPATIQQHLDALQAKGYISRTGSAFGITLKEETPQAGQSYTTAVIGTIAAGEPILAFEEYEDRIEAPQAMLVGSEHFALRVQGDSMIEDHILDGDLVVVRRQQSADDGEVVVALLDDGTATLKRLYRESGGFRLQPANSQLNPIHVDSLDVQGVVTGIVRQHI